MTALVAVPSRTGLPALPGRIPYLIQRFYDPAGLPPIPHGVTEQDRHDARLALEAYRLATPSVAQADLRAWLMMVNSGVSNPQGEADFDQRFPAMVLACGSLPELVFTPETCREALRRFKFWPAAAEVYALLDTHAEPIRAAMVAMRAIAGTRLPKREPEPVYTPPTAAEVAAVRATLAAWGEERAARPVPPPMVAPPGPKHASDEVILAGLEAQYRNGAIGFGPRIAFLRRKLGRTPPGAPPQPAVREPVA